MENGEQDIISSMVKETGDDPDSNVLPLKQTEESPKEFENLLEDLALKSEAYFSELLFIPQTHMFRFRLKGKVIDIPVNWSFFQDLYEGMRAGEYKQLTIDLNDEDGLVEAFSSYWQGVNEFTFITFNYKIYFVASEYGKSFSEVIAHNPQFLQRVFPKAA